MHDAGEYETYRQKGLAALAGHPLTPRALYGRHEVLEGPATEGVVIIEFPSYDEARAYYDSPAYREAREHRFKAADYRVIIVEGV
jgi:uncharacterized protein (DUF1330 family)